MFEKRLVAGWGDMDFNSHMRNTAFLDKSADVRMMFFSENGFSMDEFIRRKIGPVIRKDELEYFKEIRLLEELRVTLAIAGLAEDGSRFLMRNEFWRADETLAATVTSAGGGSTWPCESWWCRRRACWPLCVHYHTRRISKCCLRVSSPGAANTHLGSGSA
jgi:acyl-CoA thioester hydrolase